MTEEVFTDEQVVVEEENGTDVEEPTSEEGTADAETQNGEAAAEPVSLELHEATKDYLDPSLMNGIRIVESSELFDVRDNYGYRL